jgi:hypothetical protein
VNIGKETLNTMSRKHQQNKQAANDLVFRKIPLVVEHYTDKRKVNEIVLEHNGYRYEKIPSLGGKYVSSMLIRIVADSPAEMNGHLDAFRQWAVKTPLM